MSDEISAVEPVKAVEVEVDTSPLARLCTIKYRSSNKMFRHITLIAAIADATQNLEMIKSILLAGVRALCFDFVFHLTEFHMVTLKLVDQAVKALSKQLGYELYIALAINTKGPDIHTGYVDPSIKGKIDFRKGDIVRITTNEEFEEKCTKELIYIDHQNLLDDLMPGATLDLDDGSVIMTVKDVQAELLVCIVNVGGSLGSWCNVLVPGVDLNMPYITDMDRIAYQFAVDNKIDMIFAAGVREPSAVHEIRSELGEKGKQIKIVSKLDSMQGLRNYMDILAVSDGIMIGRRNLTKDIIPEKLFVIQKSIVARCNQIGTPVLVGEQMLELMLNHPRPSRAGSFDIGNAVVDGADGIYLARVTAYGEYPLEAVNAAANVCREAESSLLVRNMFADLVTMFPKTHDIPTTLAIAAIKASNAALAAAIICITTTGRSAFLVSRFHPRCPVIGLTRCTSVVKHMLLYRSVVPALYRGAPKEDWIKEIDSRLQYALLVGKRMGIIKDGDTVIVVTPWKQDMGYPNNLRAIYAFHNKPNVCNKPEKKTRSYYLLEDRRS